MLRAGCKSSARAPSAATPTDNEDDTPEAAKLAPGLTAVASSFNSAWIRLVCSLRSRSQVARRARYCRRPSSPAA
eukprot:scaffold307_cov63-Phaeocystis_antarctica.AAC.6